MSPEFLVTYFQILIDFFWHFLSTNLTTKIKLNFYAMKINSWVLSLLISFLNILPLLFSFLCLIFNSTLLTFSSFQD